jgi:hypothetical protein
VGLHGKVRSSFAFTLTQIAIFGNVDSGEFGSIVGRKGAADKFAESSYETTHLFINLAPGRFSVSGFCG